MNDHKHRGRSRQRGSEGPTCEEVPDLLDECSQFLVALIDSLFGSVGLHQDILSALPRLVCFRFGL